MLSIEEQREVARNTEALSDVVIKAIEDSDRFNFELGSGGMYATLYVIDKETNTNYEINIKPVNYEDEKSDDKERER